MNSEQLIAKLKQYPLAVISVLITLVLLVLIYLRADRLPALEQEYTERQAEDELIKSNATNAVDLAANLETLQANADSIQARLIDPDAKTDNYRYFLSMAELTKVSLVDPQMSPAKTDPKFKVYRTVDFPLSVTGNFADVLQFLYQIRAGDYILRVDSLSMRPASATGTNNEVQAQINITGLALPEVKEKK